VARPGNVNNPNGRPAAPRLGSIQPSRFVNRLLTLRFTIGLEFALWPKVVGVSLPTWIGWVENRGAATFQTLSSLARIAAIVGCTAADVTTSHELPPIDVDVTVADVRTLRHLAVTTLHRERAGFIARFCDQRLGELGAAVDDEPAPAIVPASTPAPPTPDYVEIVDVDDDGCEDVDDDNTDAAPQRAASRDDRRAR
jgi:hypothetical protein